MTSPELEFPALYQSADEASATAQNNFWWVIRAEYILLFLVTVLSATRGLFGLKPLWLSLIILVLAGLLIFKVVRKLDQDWYRCRALAESVKTSTWRFAMRAHPFQDADNIDQPKGEFRNLLRNILNANRHIAANLENPNANQVTVTMLSTRQLTLEQRIAFYVEHRIDNQRSWYQKKSKSNKRSLRIWVGITIFVYVLAVISLNADQLGLSPATYAFDPLIVLVTSAIGWMQMKRHSELMASYNLTAHEIGIIRVNSDSVKTEEEFSNFVNEAELAFSREHTQWVARRDAN